MIRSLRNIAWSVQMEGSSGCAMRRCLSGTSQAIRSITRAYLPMSAEGKMRRRPCAGLTTRWSCGCRERTEELEAFTYSVSHDLHGPVWMLDNYIQMLLNDHGGKMDSDLADRIGVIRKTVKQMDRLIDDLLSLSRVNRTQLRIVPLKLREIVLDAWREVITINHGREIVFDMGDLPPAAGDRNLVRQAVYNLLSNAVKFTGPGRGPPSRWGAIRRGKAASSMFATTGLVSTWANMTGCSGFFSGSMGQSSTGTGVGLTIVQRIVERHGGFIKAEGKVNGGAKFLFSLPTRV